MFQARALMLLFLAVPVIAFAERHVHFTGDFESGEIQPKSSTRDGFFIHTLPEPQSGSTSISGSNGGFGPDEKADTRVVSSDVIGGTTVRPRAGNYFIRSSLFKNKNYSELNGGRDKPRSKIYVRGTQNAVDFDEEGYLGFSIYLPDNLEHETAWDGSRGSTKVLQVQSDGASNILFILSVYVPSGKTESHWLVEHLLNDGSSSKKLYYDLGPVREDMGQWTDFVVRYRFNPFSKTTNASSVGGKDQVYEANKGILQLWKARGPMDADGNRQMTLTKANLENQPVGRVPHANSKINWHFRIYKGNWKEKPTSMSGPIWIGFDEIRDGRVLKNGTSYSDVHPGGLVCTDRCPSRSIKPEPGDTDLAPPRAPGGLSAN